MARDPLSHKGENGKVAIIGGSALIHGAPLLSALAAEASGADLLYVFVPRIHQDVARMASLNFQVHPFAGDDIADRDVEPILELLATMDAAIIGPGLARTPAALKTIRTLIAEAPCSLVLDASALQPWTLEAARGKVAVLTPHLGELERMEIEAEEIGATAKDAGVTMLVKGHEDLIAGPDGTVVTVTGGNAGLTVGGTGDALAGLIGGLLAQRLEPAKACRVASGVIKKAGEELFRERASFTAREVISFIPVLLQDLG
jgi:NAD(P)H-hydrate epimerase